MSELNSIKSSLEAFNRPIHPDGSARPGSIPGEPILTRVPGDPPTGTRFSIGSQANLSKGILPSLPQSEQGHAPAAAPYLSPDEAGKRDKCLAEQIERARCLLQDIHSHVLQRQDLQDQLGLVEANIDKLQEELHAFAGFIGDSLAIAQQF